MFKYKVNSRLLPQLRLLPSEKQGSFSIELSAHASVEDLEGTGQLEDITHEQDVVGYPLFKNSRRKKVPVTDVRNDDPSSSPGGENPNKRIGNRIETQEKSMDSGSDSELQIQIELDFGWIFGWLERLVWLTMFVSVGWAVSYNFERATREVCYLDDNTKNYPFNVLPSLSRSMSSFRVGKFVWTIIMAGVFVARLLSNHFLHRLYETWYADNWFNKLYLGLAYFLDTLEIVSLVMIPAFSLDCDPGEHSIFFKVFICLTYVAEILQYLTRFLKRKKGIVLFSDDVNNYYRQIGILIILQTLFIAFMMTGYILHDKVCGDLYYSIFTLGEYITVIINVRFKRDTVLFVK